MKKYTSPLWGPWWPAPCLVTLGAEADKAFPKRRKPDGTIGDKHHKRPSDHLPDSEDMVRARDVWAAGVDMQTLIRAFINDPHDRSHYVIYRRVIWDRDNGFKPVRYHGDNPHNDHAHFSVLGGAKGRNTRPWGLWTPDEPRPPGGIFAGGRVLRLTRPMMRGSDVEFVQRFIGRRCGSPDGIFGGRTDKGVRWYQGMRGIRADGIVGPVTWRHMLGR